MAFPLAAMMQGAGEVVAGWGRASAAKELFTDADKRRLEELQRLKREGELGLDAGEREAIRGDLASSRGALLRQQQADALESGGRQGPALSGRDIFLQQQQAAQATLDLEETGIEAEALSSQAKAIAQRAEETRLLSQRAARKAGVTMGATTGIAGALGAGGDAAETQQTQAHQVDMQTAQLESQMNQQEMISKYLADAADRDAAARAASTYTVRSGGG